ncbi:hypothetical protein BDN72DRAFT_744184, partial [Pluteus cervinus]
ECKHKGDVCANCAGDHRTSTCMNPLVRRCANCSGEHSAASRDCPVFKDELRRMEVEFPERYLPYVPTNEPWT